MIFGFQNHVQGLKLSQLCIYFYVKMTKKEKKKYKQDGEEEDSEDLGREIKMSITKKITKLRSPCHFTNEPTQVKQELCSTHRFDDEYILKSPLHKSTQVIACLEIFI